MTVLCGRGLRLVGWAWLAGLHGFVRGLGLGSGFTALRAWLGLGLELWAWASQRFVRGLGFWLGLGLHNASCATWARALGFTMLRARLGLGLWASQCFVRGLASGSGSGFTMLRARLGLGLGVVDGTVKFHMYSI